MITLTLVVDEMIVVWPHFKVSWWQHNTQDGAWQHYNHGAWHHHLGRNLPLPKLSTFLVVDTFSLPFYFRIQLSCSITLCLFLLLFVTTFGLFLLSHSITTIQTFYFSYFISLQQAVQCFYTSYDNYHDGFFHCHQQSGTTLVMRFSLHFIFFLLLVSLNLCSFLGFD